MSEYNTRTQEVSEGRVWDGRATPPTFRSNVGISRDHVPTCRYRESLVLSESSPVRHELGAHSFASRKVSSGRRPPPGGSEFRVSTREPLESLDSPETGGVH